METLTEITVFLENHPGTLAKVTGALGKQGINILGFDLTNALDWGALRLVVDDPKSAAHLFGEHNMFALEHDILQVRVRNEAGALERFSNALSKAGVNVDYAYGSAGTETGAPTTMFVRVSDIHKATEVLRTVDGVD